MRNTDKECLPHLVGSKSRYKICAPMRALAQLWITSESLLIIIVRYNLSLLTQVVYD